MYLLDLFFEGTPGNGSGRLPLLDERGELPKWTLLPSSPEWTALLQFAALACGGARFVPRLPCDLGQWCAGPAEPLRLEILVVPHSPRDGRGELPPRWGSGIEITAAGTVRALPGRSCRRVPRGVPVRKAALGSGNKTYFFLAYGPKPSAHDGTDRFDFSDPFFRVARFRSLFSDEALLTDPVELLSRLHHKACRLGRHPAKQALGRLSELLSGCLGIPAGSWKEKTCDMGQEWARLVPSQRRILLPVLDAARHAIDASPFQPQPLDIPGLFLMEGPDRFCPPEVFPRWVELLDRLFPAAQFVVALSEPCIEEFPPDVKDRRLPLPSADAAPERRRRPRVRPGAIALAHVDGTLPNLALMKLSRHFKEQGRDVVLTRKDERCQGVEATYASCVFSTPPSRKRLDVLRSRYGERLAVGGSGVDLVKRLPAEVEELPADFSLYSELGDRAIGFLTRGCPFDCPFCIVPFKEGPPRQVSDFDELLQGRKQLILLDDNILAHHKAESFLEEMVRRELEVNFTQTIDLHLVDRERAQLLRKVQSRNTRFTRSAYHFSLNEADALDRVREKYELFGFTNRDNVEFVCMYGYNTTLEQDVARFRFLRSLPGAYVFVQEYWPVPWEPAEEIEDFFGPDPDALIRELVSICFTQNMKSMEKYYRWLSKRYARTFGKLNEDLVETIFKYNRRWKKGVYVATLAHTIRRRDAPGLRSA